MTAPQTVPYADIDPEDLYTAFKKYQDQGALQYVLPSDPIGETWVLGMPEGGMLHLTGIGEAVAWLAGASAVVSVIAKSRGLVQS